MKKFFKIMGITAGAFLVTGIIFAVAGIALGGLNKTFKMGEIVINPKVEKQEYMSLDEFDTIDLDVSAGNIEIVQGKEFAIEYSLYGDVKCAVYDKTLVLSDRKNWNIQLGLPGISEEVYVKLYIPDNAVIDLKNIDAGMSNVEISDIEASNINVDADMGNVTLTDVKTKKLKIEADMGNVIFNGTAADKIIVEADMGNVTIEGYLDCDIEIYADMGKVDLTTYYSRDFYECQIDTDMGHEEFISDGGIQPENRHSMYIECNMGNATVIFRDPE